ncbi:hypothetical protein NDU88_000144 [Pleurodeles waltl]|uniref:Uncharacterized protein n=1 Tax=Pleurodeles waltl TaxID=8319 RepID=A0AAV7V4W5_PLEWA|nr:hypothetical protein NDU88_000144 [Pleurodeles waltl]
MQYSVGSQGLTSTKLGLKSHWTEGVTWTELLSSRDHARRAERGPRGPVMQSFVACGCRGKIPSTHGRFLQSSWCKKETGYPQSMHHLETVEKAGRMKRHKVASSRIATLLRFCGILSSQRLILWQKVKREMQRNFDELLHSLSEEFPKAETLNSQKRRFGYIGRRIGYQERQMKQVKRAGAYEVLRYARHGVHRTHNVEIYEESHVFRSILRDAILALGR